jgi:signal transduction histidine kinase
MDGVDGLNGASEISALEELRRLQSEFIAVAAHELRTPVAAAKSYAELLLRHENGEIALAAETRREALERLDSVCDRLGRLVRSLLGASRIQAGGLELARLPFDVLTLVRRVAADIAGAGPEHRVVVRDVPDRVVVALGDAERVEDALINLLVNATKYSPPGSAVWVDVRDEPEWVEISVTDSGPGIPEEEQVAVFERFTRGRRTSGGGVGLGLYIARAYVEAMGGAIGVRSSPGSGASFWFRLPRSRSASSAGSTASSNPSSTAR